MKRAWLPVLIVIALFAGWFGRGALAEEEPRKEVDPMEAMLAVHEPGPDQALLATLVGEWDVEVKAFNAEGKTHTSKGSAVNKMLFGGRYLQQTYKGEFAGKPFEGIGLLAHDNRKKAFQSMWIDSMSSGIYKAEGSISADRKTVTLRGSWAGPSGPIDSKDVIQLHGKDVYVMQGFMETPDGPVQNVELTYRRRVSTPER